MADQVIQMKSGNDNAFPEIKNLPIKEKIYTFNNLAQYTSYSYYISIPNAFSLAGIPSGARVVGVFIRGWSNLGSGAISVGIYSNTGIYVFFPYGTSLSSGSYLTASIMYVE